MATVQAHSTIGKKKIILLLVLLAFLISSIVTTVINLCFYFNNLSNKTSNNRKELTQLLLNAPQIEHLEIGYNSQDAICTMSVANIPTDYYGEITYAINVNIIYSGLSIINNNQLSIATGYGFGIYSYQLKISAAADKKYNSTEFIYDGKIDIGKKIPKGVVVVTPWTETNVSYGYTTQPSAQLSISGGAYDGTVTYTASNTTDFEISGTTVKLKTGRDAGFYTTTIDAIVTAGVNYSGGSFTTSSSQSIIVNKANSFGTVTVGSWSITSVDYGYTTQPSAQLSINGGAYDGTVTYSVSNATDFEIVGTTLKLKTGRNVSTTAYTTTVSAIVTAGTNYSGGTFTTSSSQSIAVNKANPVGTVIVGAWNTGANVNYGYTTQPTAQLSISGSSYDGTINYTVSNTTDFEIVGTTVKLKTGRDASTTAYTTTVSASTIGGTNYNSGNFTTSGNQIITVNKANSVGTVTVGAWSTTTPTYGYTTQPSASLSISGGAYDGTVTYSVSNTTDFEIDGTTLKLKTGRDASTTAYTTTVSATVTAGTNYSGGTFTTSSSQSIIVNKANPSGTVTVGAWSTTTPTYGYTTQPSTSLSISGGAYDGTVTYSVGNTTDFEISGTTVKLKTGKNAGTYTTTVSATVTAGTNYNSGTFTTSSSQSITVNKASPVGTVTVGSWSATSVNYNYTTQPSASLSISGGTYDGTVTYSVGNTTDFEISGTTVKLKTGKNAGTYTTTVTATASGGTNYDGSFTASSTQSITVNKINPDGNVSGYGFMSVSVGYSTEPYEQLYINGNYGNGSIIFTSSNTTDFYISGTRIFLRLGKSAGEYTTVITASTVNATNYNDWSNYLSYSDRIRVLF